MTESLSCFRWSWIELPFIKKGEMGGFGDLECSKTQFGPGEMTIRHPGRHIKQVVRARFFSHFSVLRSRFIHLRIIEQELQN